ncbi:Hypothetical Protein FCC1311_019302 [Hondaea fermentalgiana]|uniref:Uncharacterized protein n=1 Tax=Hondaea fermentalgiana TaxID=2315210 RepID=A0A2R5GC47_9STRA|nr:Hypothetical Protein FCC1311_019302 [Hondaea fermentalgiana]|eukprot:GBG25711.1 Hypothetical Protein FCC1311_019302 [Hondaea fermentalgiana]
MLGDHFVAGHCGKYQSVSEHCRRYCSQFDSEIITGAWEALFLVPGFFALGPAIVAANFGNDLYPFIRAFFQVHDSTIGSGTDSACPPDLASYDLVLLTISGLFMALTLAADAYDLWAWPSDLTVARINLSRTWPEHFPMALICLAKLVVLLPIGAVYVFRSYLPVLSPFVAAVLCELISRIAQRITGQTCEWDHSRRFLGNHTDFPIVLAEHFSVFFRRVPPVMLPVVSLAVFGITLGIDGGVGLLGHDDRVLCTPFEYRVGCWVFVAYIVYLHVLQFVNSVQNLYGVRFLVKGGNPADLLAHRRRLPCANMLGLCLMQDNGKRRSDSNTRRSSKRVQDITATAEPPMS